MARKSLKWRRWLFIGLIAAFVWALFSRFEEIKQLLTTLSGGDWRWILPAAVLQIAFYIFSGGLLKFSFDTVSLRTRLLDMIPVVFASLFVNSTTPPAGGAAGFAVTFDDARRRGGTTAQATAGALLNQIVNYGVFSFLLSIGLIILISRRDLTALQGISAAILFTATAGMAAALSLGLWNPALLRRLLDSVQRGANRLGGWVKRPSFLPSIWAEKHAGDFIEASRGVARRPGRLAGAVVAAFLMHNLSLLSLLCLFLAFGQPTTPAILIVGYTMSTLFTIVSPTPSGIGVVETVVPLIYTSLGIPAPTAVAIILAFRGLAFWIPLLVGFVLLHRLKMFRDQGKND